MSVAFLENNSWNSRHSVCRNLRTCTILKNIYRFCIYTLIRTDCTDDTESDSSHSRARTKKLLCRSIALNDVERKGKILYHSDACGEKNGGISAVKLCVNSEIVRGKNRARERAVTYMQNYLCFTRNVVA